MLTLQHIHDAHARVASGADFPRYAGEIKALGVVWYDTFVADGRTVYTTVAGVFLTDEPVRKPLPLSGVNPVLFRERLAAHQRGESTYDEFCLDCARTGVEKWRVDLSQMTCTYYDMQGQALVVEEIPAA
jgi:uncharacterized protein YbcV (DUF1398 family)